MKSFLRFRIAGIAVAAIAVLAIGALPALGTSGTSIGTNISTSGTFSADGNTTLGAYTNNLSTSSASLFADSTTNRVGIGTITPGATLQVVSSTHSTGAPVFQVYNSEYDDIIFNIESKGRAQLNNYDDYNGAGAALTLNQYGTNAGPGLYVEQHGMGGNAGAAIQAVQDNHSKPSLVTSGGAVNLNVDSNYDVNLATGTSNGTVTIGSGNSPVVINTSSWGVDGSGNATGLASLGVSGTITGGTLTDGTASLSSGALTGLSGLTVSGTIQGGTVTDGTASLTGGVLSGLTGFTASGTIQGGTLTDGTASLTGGVLTGNVTGEVTGNASTATALQTPRLINGVSFDGTSDITITTGLGAYAMFYGLTSGTGNGGPSDYVATIAPGALVPFPKNGPAFGGVTSTATPGVFQINTIGTYEVSFRVHTAEPGQLELAIDNGGGYVELPQCTAEDMNSTAGGHQIIGNCIITTTGTNAVVKVINPAGNASALTVVPADGSQTHANSETLIIKKL